MKRMPDNELTVAEGREPESNLKIVDVGVH